MYYNHEELKDVLLRRLRCRDGKSNWLDGDLSEETTKKMDIVSDERKIAIEIKVDKAIKNIEQVGILSLRTENPHVINNRLFYDDIKKCNKKARNYPGYKTVAYLYYPEYDERINGVVEKSNFSKFKNIGCCLLLLNDGTSYYENKNASLERIISKEEISKLLI